jgi:hypothetical protein
MVPQSGNGADSAHAFAAFGLYLPFLAPKMQVFNARGKIADLERFDANPGQLPGKTGKLRACDIFRSWFPCVRKAPQTNRKQINPAFEKSGANHKNGS